MESDAVRAVFNQTSSALAALTVLKKICDHPALLTERSARLAADGGTLLDKSNTTLHSSSSLQSWSLKKKIAKQSCSIRKAQEN